MKTIPSVLTDFGIFTVDEEYRGQIHAIELPTVEWNGTEIPTGLGIITSNTALSEMTAKITSYEFLDAMEGAVLNPSMEGQRWVFMGSHEHQGGEGTTVRAIKITLGGQWRSVAHGSVERGSSDSVREYTCQVNYYKLEADNRPLLEIDLLNVIAIGPEGTDYLADRRQAVGLNQ